MKKKSLCSPAVLIGLNANGLRRVLLVGKEGEVLVLFTKMGWGSNQGLDVPQGRSGLRLHVLGR